jgi:hypothetical protein
MLRVSRREFIQGTTGLVVTVALPTSAAMARVAVVSETSATATAAEAVAPNAYIQIGTDNLITVMRRAGATARALLVRAAAEAWNLPAGRLRVTRGTIWDPVTERRGLFGEFAARAARLPVPTQMRVKSSQSPFEDTWSAMQGRAALMPTWDDSGAEARGSEDMFKQYLAQTEHTGRIVAERGTVDSILSGSGEQIEQTFAFPFLAHATMEPSMV